MKSCVFLLCLTVTLPAIMSMTEELKEMIDNLHKICVAETEVEEALIQKTNSEKVLPDDDKLKCYIKCLMVHGGCMSDEGIVDEEATIAAIPAEYKSLIEPIVTICGTKVGADPCENAWLTHKCYVQQIPDTYMLI